MKVSSSFLCPGLWVMAAKFEFEDLKDVSSARVLLQQGLRANPTSKHLWIEVGCGKGGWEGGRGRERWVSVKEGQVEWRGREWERRMGRVGMGDGIGWRGSRRLWGEYEGRWGERWSRAHKNGHLKSV